MFQSSGTVAADSTDASLEAFLEWRPPSDQGNNAYGP